MDDKKHVIIVGGGVIGLSIAISLLDHPKSPYSVTVIAKDLPDLDSRTYSPTSQHGSAAHASYASAWAGGHHVSGATNAEQRKRDQVTFDTFCKLDEALQKTQWNAKDARPFFWSHEIEYWESEEMSKAQALDWYPDYKPIKKSKLPGVSFGCSLSTFNFVIPRYLPMLFAYVLSLGGQVLRKSVISIAEAIDLAAAGSPTEFVAMDEKGRISRRPSHLPDPTLVVATPGLGAKELLGDGTVHPVRGQTLLLRAPWCTADRIENSPAKDEDRQKYDYCGMSVVSAKPEEGRGAYMIPRGDGTFIVGGTRLRDDWDVAPRPETMEQILRGMLKFAPSLAKPEAQDGVEEAFKGTADANDASKPKLSSLVDIVDVNVGLRPGRQEGIRIERATQQEEKHLSKGLPLVMSYGYGGTGYQSSWGSAFETRALVDEALGRAPLPVERTWRQLDDDAVRLPLPSSLLEHARLTR